MTEPLRTAPGNDESAEGDREALIERLLVAGLDHYFEGRYEQAVNVWTRVAFLERGHGRARAYIERARGAIAERQRQSDEFLQSGLDAYRAGDLPRARDLLTRAVADGGSETALVFLQRLGIAEAGHAASASEKSSDGRAASTSRLTSRRRGTARSVAGRTNWFLTIGVSAAAASVILLAAQPIASWLGEWPVASPAGSPRREDPLPIGRTAESRLFRARELYAAGRLREALAMLERIDKADPIRDQADVLTAKIQGDVLSSVPTNRGAPQSGHPGITEVAR